MFTIERALTEKQKYDAQYVRYLVYVVQDGKYQDGEYPDKRISIKHDDEPSTIVLVGYYKGKPVATITGYAYSEKLGLPVKETLEKIEDFEQIAKKYDFDFDEFVKEGGGEDRLYSCGNLAIDENYRGNSTMLFIWLNRFCFELGRRQGCEEVIVTANHRLRETLECIGFECLIKEPLYSKEIGNKIFLMKAKTADLAKVLELQSVPDWCEEEFSSATRICIWHNENMVEVGEEGDEFFLILEGSAKVVTETDNVTNVCATLNQGQTVGEMSLFGGKRTATVKTSYCVAKSKNREDVLSIIESTKRSVPLSKVMVKRLVDSNNRLIEMGKIHVNNNGGHDILSKIFPKEFIEKLPVKTIPANTVLCKIGDKGTTAYGIKKGGIKVTLPQGKDKELVVARVLPPSLVGHLIFFSEDECRTANMITASEETELYVIEENKFWELFDDYDNRFKIMKNYLELNAKMNALLNQNPDSEDLVISFKNWILNFFKTQKLQKAIGAINGSASSEVNILKKDNLLKELSLGEKSIDNMLEQLVNAKVVEINENKEIKLLSEDALQNFKFELAA